MLLLSLLITAVLSWSLTGYIRRFAIKKNLIDVPNARSSHSIPVPRGGGLAIVIIFSLGVVVSLSFGVQNHLSLLSMLVAGGVVAIIGFMDDRGHVSPPWRLAAHFFAAGLALFLMGEPLTISVFGYMLKLGLLGYVVSAVALVWFLNLFNFMDGIDGIAASEAIFLGGGGLLFAYFAGHGTLELVAILLIGSVLGFLIWNWPPAKIFLGDTGSGFIGIIIGIYAYWSILEGVVSIYAWLILAGVFLLDSTVTLLRRVMRKAVWYQAHRSHAYQHAAQKWGHYKVTLAVSLVNLFWLLPIAYMSNIYRDWGAVFMMLAFSPILVLVLMLGAGKEENS